PNPRYLLQPAEDSEQIAGARVAARTEHPHQALGRRPSLTCQPLKPHGGVNIVAQDRLPGIHISGKHLLDRLGEQRSTKRRIALGAGFHGFLEAACQSHVIVPPSAVVCSRSNTPVLSRYPGAAAASFHRTIE